MSSQIVNEKISLGCALPYELDGIVWLKHFAWTQHRPPGNVYLLCVYLHTVPSISSSLYCCDIIGKQPDLVASHLLSRQNLHTSFKVTCYIVINRYWWLIQFDQVRNENWNRADNVTFGVCWLHSLQSTEAKSFNYFHLSHAVFFPKPSLYDWNSSRRMLITLPRCNHSLDYHYFTQIIAMYDKNENPASTAQGRSRDIKELCECLVCICMLCMLSVGSMGAVMGISCLSCLYVWLMIKWIIWLHLLFR